MARRGRDNPRDIENAAGEAVWDDAEEVAEVEQAEEALEQAQLPDLDVPPAPRTSPSSAPLDDWRPAPAVSYAASNADPAPAADLDDPDLPYWLALNRIRGIGPARFRLLLEAYGSAEQVWRGDARGWQAAGLDARTTAAFEAQRRRIAPEAELERLLRLRVGALRYTDPGYPRLLCEITPPPAILYIRGTLAPADEWALAVVGAGRGGHTASDDVWQADHRAARRRAGPASHHDRERAGARHRQPRPRGGARRRRAHHRRVGLRA